MERAQLVAQVAAMTQELNQKNKDIRRYHAKQAVVFNKIREQMGHPGEVVNKTYYLYDWMMDTGDSAFATQTLRILVKYSQMMKDILAEIQRIILPNGTPRRVLYPSQPGSRTGTLYEVVGKVALVPNPPAEAGPNQQGGTSQPTSFGRAPGFGKDPLFPGEAKEHQVY